MLGRQKLAVFLTDATRPAIEVSEAELGFSVGANLVAHSTGGQANATPIVFTLSEFTSVAADNDSAVLPPAMAGMLLLIANASQQSKSLNVFPASGESINGGSADAPFALASAKRALFFCIQNGNWYSLVTA